MHSISVSSHVPKGIKNSMNHDQIQELYVYQRHSISDNRYIPWYSSNKYFPLLSVGWYLFRAVSGTIYLPRGSNENTLCITSTDNVSVAILLLDLVMIHQTRWVQGKSFRENLTIAVITKVTEPFFQNCAAEFQKLGQQDGQTHTMCDSAYYQVRSGVRT